MSASQRVVDELKRLLDENVGDPDDWSDAAKLRLLALWFDARDARVTLPIFSEPGENVQSDLRRIATRLEGQVAE